MKLIVGLGNPGDKYEKTRHNTGFLFVDYIYNNPTTYNLQLTTAWKKNKSSNAIIAELRKDDEKIILVKPQTFMNDSGRAVKNIAIMYKLKDLHDLYIIHDDIDLEFGTYKIQSERGSAGHNGVQSIIDYMKTNGFVRIRVGIYPAHIDNKAQLDITKFVLKRFNQEELKILYEKIFSEILSELTR